MNWYLKSQIEQRGLVPSDIFSFYVANALSDQALLENEKVLFDAVVRASKIREYYLGFLKKEIKEELENALYDSDALCLESDYDDYLVIDPSFDIDFETFLEQYHQNITPEDLEKTWDYHNDYDDFFMSADYVLAPDVENRLINTINKLENSKDYSYTLISDIKDFFTSLPWRMYDKGGVLYGGEQWAKITQWFWVLHNTPPVDIYNQPLKDSIQQFKYLSRVIDTINSLYHNNASLLTDLPHDEGKWIINTLDFVQASPSMAGLAYFSDNQDLAKAARSDLMSQGVNIPQNRMEFVKNIIPNVARKLVMDKRALDYGDAVMRFAKNIYSPSIIRSALDIEFNEVDEYLWHGLLENPHLWQHEDLVIMLIKKFIKAKGIEETLYILQELGSNYLSADIEYTPEFLEYIKNIEGENVKGLISSYLLKNKLYPFS